MATDAQTPSEGEINMDPNDPEVQGRWAQGPLEVFLPPGFEDNPGLPPEVWQHPPAGYELPK